VKNAKVVVAVGVAAARVRSLWRPAGAVFDKAPQRELIGKKFFLAQYIDNLLYKATWISTGIKSKLEGK
jgi:hypothetical protein